MGMGLLAAGALSGLGDAGKKVGEAFIKHDLSLEEQDYLLKRKQAFKLDDEARTEEKAVAKREAFIGEMDAIRTAKLGENAGNLNQAADIYRSADGLSDADRQANPRDLAFLHISS